MIRAGLHYPSDPMKDWSDMPTLGARMLELNGLVYWIRLSDNILV